MAANDEFEAAVRALNAESYTPDTNDWAIVRAWLLLCVLDPDHHTSQLAKLVDDLDPTYADQQSWWHALRTAPEKTPAMLVLALLAHPAATQQTHRQAEQARQAEEERLRAREQEVRAKRDAREASERWRKQQRDEAIADAVRFFLPVSIVLTFPVGWIAWLLGFRHNDIATIFVCWLIAAPIAFVACWAFASS